MPRLCLFIGILLSLAALTRAADPEVVRLWESDAPGALGTAPTDIPDLTVFPASPETASGAAMVICPGGGYGGLAGHEGAGYAKFLAERGVACFVLKYRLGKNDYRHPAMLNDVNRAVRLVRAGAEKWKIDPQRIGVMGSSAGGHLASMAVTHFDAGDPNAADPVDRLSSRPNLGVLCYPVITMGEFTHGGSRGNLIGTKPSPELVKETSSELNVTPDTPPCFVWHTWEDKAVPVENTLLFAEALRKAKVPFDLHIYQLGGHGMGLGSRDPKGPFHPWADALIHWLKVQKFVNK